MAFDEELAGRIRELVQADLQSAEKRLERVERDAKSGDKEVIVERDVLQKLVPVLRAGKAARTVQLDEKERQEKG